MRLMTDEELRDLATLMARFYGTNSSVVDAAGEKAIVACARKLESLCHSAEELKHMYKGILGNKE